MFRGPMQCGFEEGNGLAEDWMPPPVGLRAATYCWFTP